MSYRVIVADPPWAYNDRRQYRRDNPSRKAKSGIGAAGHYSRGVMNTAELCQMDGLVKGVSASDAYLFLWATCPLLPSALQVLEAWGFRYIGVAFHWTKTYPGSGLPFRGPGRYVPANVELVLLGVRESARPWHPATGPKPIQEIRCPHPRDVQGRIIHSRKPEALQDRLVAWLGPHIGPHGWLELFATRRRPGWTCLGYDVTGRDIRDDLAELCPALQTNLFEDALSR